MIMENALPKRSQAIIVARENIVSKVVEKKNKGIISRKQAVTQGVRFCFSNIKEAQK